MSTHLRIQRELGHDTSQRSKAAVVVQRRQIVQQFQGTHEGFWRRVIYVIKPDKILDTIT